MAYFGTTFADENAIFRSSLVKLKALIKAKMQHRLALFAANAPTLYQVDTKLSKVTHSTVMREISQCSIEREADLAVRLIRDGKKITLLK